MNYFYKNDTTIKVKFSLIISILVSIMRNLIGAIGFLILLVGLSFKIMHWPLAPYMFIGGTLFSIVYFLLPKKRKRSNSNILDSIEKPSEDDEIPKSRKIGELFRNIGMLFIIISIYLNTNHQIHSIFLLWFGVLITGIGVFILYRP